MLIEIWRDDGAKAVVFTEPKPELYADRLYRIGAADWRYLVRFHLLGNLPFWDGSCDTYLFDAGPLLACTEKVDAR